MTDTVADPAVTPTSAQAEVTVSAAVVDAVRAQFAGRGIPETAEVVLFDLDPRAGVTVGRMDPARGTIADPYTDSGLTLDALDQVIADHLVRVGRVAAPTSREWHEEVLDLVRRGRERLRESDGTFLMGRDHIRLFRMARRDIAEAGAPLTARAEDLARAAVSGAAAPAVVITDRVSAWLGLRDAVARAVPVPVVDVEPSGNATRPAMSGGHAAEPDEPEAGVVPDRSVPDDPATERQEVTAPEPTPIFEAVNQSPPTPAPTPAPTIATAFGALAPSGATPHDPSSSHGAGQRLPDPPPADRPAPDGNVPHAVAGPEQHPTTDSALAGSPLTGGRRRRGTRVLAVIGVLCAVAVVAVATALAVTHDEPSPAVAAPLPQRTISSPEPEFADPAILAEARQPARRYTPPPPPETSASVESAPRPRPRPRTPRPQRGVTIPNPIPGLPPIVLP
ncbi:hypothetical protein GTC6_16605 [Gordonia terrae C-6]|uniref:Uncharacterized protein n=1 Tax=Gordonia terrae C-6 TaxID=1316928 RepID=R7Y7F9_9ACTN|nr:hypothetical protein [Gordonia terrae]EON31619.1 hypothetical protein GTC6_16605 [Gordonia terrae C-6]